MSNNGKIMFIDSDPVQGFMYRCAFALKGYEVQTAASLFEAKLWLGSSCKPDILIIEVDMPDGDGFEFIREQYGQTTASIVFLTSRAEDADMVEGLRLGADEYIKKPFNMDVMVARIEALMRARKNARQRVATAVCGNAGVEKKLRRMRNEKENA